MTRYEAYLEKGWEDAGLAHVIVARVRDNGHADIGSFLVDLHCLGVKDAAFATDYYESELEEFVKDKFPEEFRERMHPACAKKLIEGALEYAQSLGFAPHRDYRKARKVLSGIDASTCPREFTYGRDGRPCYTRGPDDTDERVDRILQILEARCGADGFDYVIGAGLESDVSVRDEFMMWLEEQKPEVPRFYEMSGMITAMLICPTFLSPLALVDWLEEIVGEPAFEAAEDVETFMSLAGGYWNTIADLILETVESGGTVQPIDIDMEALEEKAENEDEADMFKTAAMLAWTMGFKRVLDRWPEAWAGARARPDLAPHFEMIDLWMRLGDESRMQTIADALEEDPPRTLAGSITAIACALRTPPVGPRG
jgi:hypothetical protein